VDLGVKAGTSINQVLPSLLASDGKIGFDVTSAKLVLKDASSTSPGSILLMADKSSNEANITMNFYSPTGAQTGWKADYLDVADTQLADTGWTNTFSTKLLMQQSRAAGQQAPSGWSPTVFEVNASNVPNNNPLVNGLTTLVDSRNPPNTLTAQAPAPANAADQTMAVTWPNPANLPARLPPVVGGGQPPHTAHAKPGQLFRPLDWLIVLLGWEGG
jgi:hypothetical protein